MDAEIFAKPGHLINRAARLLIRRGERHFGALGLAVAQLPVLGALKNGEAMSQTELARLGQIEQPTMAQLLVRMERDGLIRRTPDPGDRRSSLVSLTPAAREKLPAARALLLRGNEEALVGFSDQEIETLCSLLRRVIHNVEEGLRKDAIG